MTSRHRQKASTTGAGGRYIAPKATSPAWVGDSGPKARKTRPGGITCMECHYWFPLGIMPQVGECGNPASRSFERPTFADKPSESCFVARSLAGLEFLWCQTHRQTIYFAEAPAHKGCRLFASSVNLPVDEQAELTLAGD